MPENSGYLYVLEECLKRKVPKGEYIDSCDILFNTARANTFEIGNLDTPRQVRSVLAAFMEHYHYFVKSVTITSNPEKKGATVILEVPEDKQYEFVKVLDAIYSGVKNEVKEAEAVLENAKKNL
ncbi:MAG: hypothetical protein ABIF85_00955 [Nanoarchaeota archaeon]|nr:hypothetical protein [Nanoarchaeota archaeon]MBU4299718.1 hypothetical protein [Nanoarchaeota archaeon]MBU4451441.1 hypothetical protein [Nanoarchaeota archaeon]MCG2723791.1 hypothetical protein [archaeon]